MKKIILIGYMGSGKSTVSRLLAQKMNFNSYDLDDLIEEEEQQTIASIFSKKGEVWFRKLETTSLEEFLDKKQNCILSLGGGTPCYGSNMKLINDTGAETVYLRASVSALVERLRPEKDKRPLIATIPDNKLEEFVAKHLFERSYYYEKSKYVVNVDEKSPIEIVEELMALLI